MRRFIILALFGGLMTLAGHAFVSLGLHPGSTASVAALLQGCAALVVGAALFITGMLGLADGYEQLAARLAALLETKDTGAVRAAIPVTDAEALQESNRQFWRGYSRAGGGIVLFLGGLILLAASLAGASVQVFAVSVGAGIVAFAAAALFLSVGGLRRVRRAHAGAHESAQQLERLPDRRAEPDTPAPRRRVPRYALFPRGQSGMGRGLDRQRGAEPRVSARP